jgi:hypothetical protein
MTDEVGLENCLIGLKRVVGFAEEKRVTLIMEGLNSKYTFSNFVIGPSNQLAHAAALPQNYIAFEYPFGPNVFLCFRLVFAKKALTHSG